MNKPTNLENAISQGWIIKSETKTYVTMKAPKKFGWMPFILLTLILNIWGLMGYLIYYYVKEGGRVYSVNKTKEGELIW